MHECHVLEVRPPPSASLLFSRKLLVCEMSVSVFLTVALHSYRGTAVCQGRNESRVQACIGFLVIPPLCGKDIQYELGSAG